MNLDTLISNALDPYRRLLTADEIEEMRRGLVEMARDELRLHRGGGHGLILSVPASPRNSAKWMRQR